MFIFVDIKFGAGVSWVDCPREAIKKLLQRRVIVLKPCWCSLEKTLSHYKSSLIKTDSVHLVLSEIDNNSRIMRSSCTLRKKNSSINLLFVKRKFVLRAHVLVYFTEREKLLSLAVKEDLIARNGKFVGYGFSRCEPKQEQLSPFFLLWALYFFF